MTRRIGAWSVWTSIAGLLLASEASAQSLGIYRFQLQPSCNVLTLSEIQQGGAFMLQGFDDHCGDGQRTAVVGTGFLNPDGSIAMGLSTILTPGGAPVHLEASVHVASLNGAWRDSIGNHGGFVFTPAAGIGGSQRGGPANGIAPNSVTFDQLASSVVDAIPPRERFRFFEDGTLEVFDREALLSGLPFGAFGWRATDGQFFAGLADLRTGGRSQGPIDDSLGGVGSWGGGLNPRAAGTFALAFGDHARADGDASVAVGRDVLAAGHAAVAMGATTGACGDGSVALGELAATASDSDFMGTLNDMCGGIRYRNAFVFSDGSAPTLADADGSFTVRASGGVTFYAGAPGAPGCKLNAATGGWNCSSDRRLKTGFAPVDGEEVLRKLAAIPVESWSFSVTPGVRHIGPAAQDFHAAFGLGSDDTSIGYTDINGINMRAIQALEARTREVADLEARVAALERLVSQLLAERR